MTELQRQYAYSGPMSQTNHADLMARVAAARRQINAALGANYAEVLLYALGRITPTADAEMPRDEVAAGCGEWTGD